MSAIKCGICPHGCALGEGQTGFCLARACRGGRIVDENYGRITSLALDPIEKKPLRRFYPGSLILSAGSYGCNLRCPFCQNYGISMARREDAAYISPEELARRAEQLVSRGNIGLAYTYNEPLVGFEYVLDCAKLISAAGLKNVLVTNGYINPGPLETLLPHIHALNIDLKAFSDAFYKKISGDLETVKNTITACAKRCHVEVTTLIVPGENDSPDEMEELSGWLASVDASMALHVTRFFPRYKKSGGEPTPVEIVYSLADVARRHLSHVYVGNC